eukprot:gene38622-20015_t
MCLHMLPPSVLPSRHAHRGLFAPAPIYIRRDTAGGAGDPCMQLVAVKKPAPKKAGGQKKGAKAKKKKWSKGKTREKLDNSVMWEKGSIAKLENERLKVNGSMARAALKHLEEKGVIKPVSMSRQCKIYTRATAE